MDVTPLLEAFAAQLTDAKPITAAFLNESYEQYLERRRQQGFKEPIMTPYAFELYKQKRGSYFGNKYEVGDKLLFVEIFEADPAPGGFHRLLTTVLERELPLLAEQFLVLPPDPSKSKSVIPVLTRRASAPKTLSA